jgi:serine O-acetyltransferase
MTLFKNIRSDLATHGGDWGAQGFWALCKFIQIITGIELPCEVPIGKGFVIEHSGGIVISGFARFGENCRIRNGVVIGLARVSEPCAPQFGDNVDIGAGAKVLGNIRIGDNVLIGANAVVITDVPSNSIAVGVPAVVKPRTAPSQRVGE